MKKFLIIALLVFIPSQLFALVNIDCKDGASVVWKSRGLSESLYLSGLVFPSGNSISSMTIPCRGFISGTTSIGDPPALGFKIDVFNPSSPIVMTSTGWTDLYTAPTSSANQALMDLWKDTFSPQNQYFIIGVICAIVFISGLKTVR